MTAAWQATTVGELVALTADLPDAPARRRVVGTPVTAVLVAAAALAALVVLVGLLAATGAVGWAHMGSMMATVGTMSGCH